MSTHKDNGMTYYSCNNNMVAPHKFTGNIEGGWTVVCYQNIKRKIENLETQGPRGWKVYYLY